MHSRWPNQLSTGHTTKDQDILLRASRQAHWGAKCKRTGQILWHESLLLDTTEGRMLDEESKGRKQKLNDIASKIYEIMKRGAGN